MEDERLLVGFERQGVDDLRCVLLAVDPVQYHIHVIINYLLAFLFWSAAVTFLCYHSVPVAKRQSCNALFHSVAKLPSDPLSDAIN